MAKRNHLADSWNRYIAIYNTLVQLMGGHCKLCYTTPNVATLEFHHLRASEKLHSVSSLINAVSLRINPSDKLYKQLFDEASKCWLLCPTCHANLHKEQIDHGEDKEIRKETAAAVRERWQRWREEREDVPTLQDADEQMQV